MSRRQCELLSKAGVRPKKASKARRKMAKKAACSSLLEQTVVSEVMRNPAVGSAPFNCLLVSAMRHDVDSRANAFAPQRCEFGWFRAMPLCAQDGDVCQLTARLGAAQHEPSSAHVSSTDEFRGEHQLLTEDGQQRLDIFRRGNAAQ